MKIRLEHQNIGAALMQVAEHPQFTSINALQMNGNRINNGFSINNDIVLFCKYATEPNNSCEYLFTFTSAQCAYVDQAIQQRLKTFLALICVEDGEICCLDGQKFKTLLNYRQQSSKCVEDQYQILVTARKNSSLRVFVNAAGKKGHVAGKMLTISRSAFPGAIFL